MTLSCHVRGLLQPSLCGQEMTTGEVMFAGTVSSDARPGLITHTVEMKYNPDTCTILCCPEPFHFSISHLMLSHTAIGGAALHEDLPGFSLSALWWF